MSTQELTKPETMHQRALAMQTQANEMAGTMKELGIEASDLVIPRLMLMQNTSEFVGDGLAKLGDIINSQTSEVLGGLDSPVEIIPLRLSKTLRVYDQTQNPPKFIRSETLTAENAKRPYEEDENGVRVRNYQTFNFFALLKKEIDAGEAFPVVVSFKSTSLTAGRQIATHIFKMAALGKLPYSQSILLTVSKEKKGTNTWATFGTAKGNLMGDVEKAESEKWLSILASVTHRVDDQESEIEQNRTPEPTVVRGEGRSDLY